MPIYQFKCTSCEHEQEHLLKTGQVIDVCPSCGKNTYQKQLTAPGLLNFSGSGFYQTDFKTPCGQSVKEVKNNGCAGDCACVK